MDDTSKEARRLIRRLHETFGVDGEVGAEIFERIEALAQRVEEAEADKKRLGTEINILAGAYEIKERENERLREFMRARTLDGEQTELEVYERQALRQQ